MLDPYGVLGRGTKPRDYRAPYWSWASVDSNIYLVRRPTKGVNVHWFIDEEDCTAKVDNVGTHDTGEVTWAQLKLRGHVAIIHMDTKKDTCKRRVRKLEDPLTGAQFEMPPTSPGRFDHEVTFDDDEDMPTEAFLYSHLHGER